MNATVAPPEPDEHMFGETLVTRHSVKIENHERRISDLEKEVESNCTAIGALDTKIDDMRAEFLTAQGQMKLDLQAGLTDIKTWVLGGVAVGATTLLVIIITAIIGVVTGKITI